MRMLDYLEAAACLWEAFLDRVRRDEPIAAGAVYHHGYSSCRITVVQWAAEVQQAWGGATDYHDDLSFDRDFVPDWLHDRLKMPVEWL